MICPECKNIYPSHYKKCIECGAELVKERFAPQEKEIEKIEAITPYVENGDIDDFES